MLLFCFVILRRERQSSQSVIKIYTYYIKGLDFFGDFFLFFFGNFFCFPVWLAFPCVFHWFSFIFLTCPLFSIDFPCFSLVFHWFYFNFLIFPLFSIGFPWFSLVFLIKGLYT